MDKIELKVELKAKKQERTKLLREIAEKGDLGLMDEVLVLKGKVYECNREITYLEREIEGNFDKLYCCIKLSDLRDALVDEELKQIQADVRLIDKYCELMPIKIVCFEKGKKYGNNFIENSTVKENLDILAKQQYLAFKIYIPTNNKEHTYAFAVKIHMNKKLADDISLKQELIKAGFDVNAIKADDLYVDITVGILQKYYKTCFEKVLNTLIGEDWYGDTLKI